MSKSRKLTKQEVLHIASLAKIKLTEDEVKKFQTQLASILDYVKKLSDIDTKSIKYRSHVALKNVFREDEVESSLKQDEALSNRQSSEIEGSLSIRSTLRNNE